jgi:hypothetical protein
MGHREIEGYVFATTDVMEQPLVAPAEIFFARGNVRGGCIVFRAKEVMDWKRIVLPVQRPPR